MEFMEVVRARRSIRRFRPDPVPEAALEQILEAGRLAPSPGGAQSWLVGVVREPRQRELLAQAAGEQHWIASAPVVLALCGRIGRSPAGEPGEFARVVNEARFGADVVAHCAQFPDQRAMGKLWSNAAPLIAGTQMYLAAVSAGLSGCWVGYLDTDRASQILDLPEKVVCLFLLPIGYADETPEGVERRPLQELTFHDAWRRR